MKSLICYQGLIFGELQLSGSCWNLAQNNLPPSNFLLPEAMGAFLHPHSTWSSSGPRRVVQYVLSSAPAHQSLCWMQAVKCEQRKPPCSGVGGENCSGTLLARKEVRKHGFVLLLL